MKAIHMTSAAWGALALMAAVSPAFAGTDPTGVWLDDKGRGAVEIKSCGTNLCGYVVAVINDRDAKGCGKQIIGDAKAVGGGVWSNGWIYSPERRKNYDVELKPLADGTLRVVGYAGTKLFSRTMIWTAAPADLKRCDGQPSAPSPTGATPPQTTEANPAAPDSASPQQEQGGQPAPTQTPSDTRADAPSTEETASRSSSGVSQSTPPPGSESGVDTPTERVPGAKLGFDLDQVLKRTDNGTCKLDLPWVKVEFECDRR